METAISKAFVVYTLDGTLVGRWEKQSQCAKDLGIAQSHICGCLIKKRKSHKNYVFAYEEDAKVKPFTKPTRSYPGQRRFTVYRDGKTLGTFRNFSEADRALNLNLGTTRRLLKNRSIRNKFNLLLVEC